MQIVGNLVTPDELPAAPPLLPSPPPTTTKIDQELIERAAWKAGIIGGLNVATQILAARLIVLIAVLGGIGLTWTALSDPNPYKLIALGIYAVGVVGSSVWLAGR